jgi:hypothetical protein
VLRLLGQVMTLPIAAFIYGVEILVLAIRDIQRSAADGAATMVTGVTPGRAALPAAAPAPESRGAPTAAEAAAGAGDTVAAARPAGAAFMEDRPMADNSLNDDMLKLVRYKILFVKRDYEVAFPEVEELVPDNITGNAFTAWKIAEFIQHLDDTDAPRKWREKGYPRAYPKNGPFKIGDFEDEGDKKYLRVYYEVLDRYVREKFKYEEEHIDRLKDNNQVLREIRDLMPRSAASGGATSSGGGSSAGPGGAGAAGSGGTGTGGTGAGGTGPGGPGTPGAGGGGAAGAGTGGSASSVGSAGGGRGV